MHKLKIFILYLHNVVKRLGMLITKVNFVKFWLKCSIFQLIVNRLQFSCFGRSKQRNEDKIFCRDELFHNLGKGKLYPAALQKIPTQTVDLPQVFESWVLQKQPKMINKMTKSWDRNTISDLEQVCTERDRDLLSWLLSSKTISSTIISHSSSVICFVSSISEKECYRKKSRRVEKIKVVVNTNTIHTYKTNKCCIGHSP